MSRQQTGYATGMAGEFHVMEQLFRLGHQPTLSLGNAKSIDILTRSTTGKIYQIDVKASRGGGKWPLGKEVNTGPGNIVYIFLLYKKFGELGVQPESWIIPAAAVSKLQRPWHKGTVAVFNSQKDWGEVLAPYKNAWAEYLA